MSIQAIYFWQCAVSGVLAMVASGTMAQQVIAPKTKFRAFEQGGVLNGSINSLALGGDGRLLVTAGSEGDGSLIRLFRIEGAAKIRDIKVEPGQNEPVVAAPDGTHFVYVHAFRTAQIADFKTGDVGKKIQPPDEDNGLSFCRACFFSEKEKLLVISQNSDMLAWDILSGHLKNRWSIGDDRVSSACLVGEGAVAVGDSQGVLRICDLRTGAVTRVLSDT